jgi:hypothetical protein
MDQWGQQMLNQRHEQRKTIRRPARRAATVNFGRGKPFVNCRIWHISEDGARLAVAHSPAESPHHFTLSWFKDGSAKRDCEVVWTDRRFVAAKFTDPVS